ncbi:MAG: FkbM family methyltransferase [Rhabdochlamydiaceae bacterium]|nr:FkbM family methyltransferase [Rhabdochlamydiaceae bacterium]
MKVFEQTNKHSLVSLLEERMEQANFKQTQKEIFQKLPKDFDIESSAIFYTPGEDYLETIDIVEAVSSAKKRFVMFELGAGYGRWCINAMNALKFLNPIPFHFVAVEAEISHFRFLKEYFIAHGLNLKDHKLIKAAVDVNPGKAVFHMGDANEWYGQCIDSEKVTFFNRISYAIKNKYHNYFGKNALKTKGVVKTITLNSLLEKYEHVDLIDMDIQGFELAVLEASIDLLNKKVKRLHIGTHSKEIDEGLKNLFQKHGWQNVHLFPCLATSTTPYGVIEFNDGIQSWANPRI